MEKLTVLSGAGISAESGITTFRDSGGLWEQYRIEDVCTAEAWQRNPALVTEFYNERRQQLLSVKPNKAHFGLAELEKNFEVRIITQNVDNLHERAGSTNVLHLHGELTKVRSERYPDDIYELAPDNYHVKIGDLCKRGYQLRPHIVFFGEQVPNIEKAAEWVENNTDIFVVIGTSLNVYPAAGLLHYANGIPVYIIDPNPVAMNNPRWHFIRKTASEGVTELMNILKK